jgi:hypothetical protein
MPSPESSLLQSWHDNADAWIEAIRSGAIESRQQVTDQAILLAIMSRQPQRVLDLGCGEGWLLRALADRGLLPWGGWRCAAGRSGASGGAAQVHVASYEALVDGTVDIGRDYRPDLRQFLAAASGHYSAACRDACIAGSRRCAGHSDLASMGVAAGDYQDGWREESFAGFKGQWQPMPWYFRTLSSWLNALDMAGFQLAGLQEPQHPQSPVPQSLLMVAERR